MKNSSLPDSSSLFHRKYQKKKVRHGKWNKSGNLKSRLLKKLSTYVKQKKEGKTEVYQTLTLIF